MPPVSGHAFPLSNGLLTDSDLISLCPDLELYCPYLTDRVTGARHELHDLALRAVAAVAAGPVRAQRWTDDMVASGMTPSQARETIGFLNLVGGLNVRRTARGHAEAFARGTALFLGKAGWPARTFRLPTTFAGISIAVCKAASIPVALAPIAAVLAVATHLADGDGVRLGFTALATLLVGSVAHEFGHALALAHYGMSSAVMQRGMRLGILRGELSPKRAAYVAVSGPVMGMLITGCLGSALELTGVRGMGPLGVALSLLHMLSLLPFYGDGRDLTSYLHQIKQG